MLTKIEELLHEVENMTANNAEELEALRIKYLSKKGAINALMTDFRNVPAEQKKEVGMKLNELKNLAQERIATLKETFDNQDSNTEGLDLTRHSPSAWVPASRSPSSLIKSSSYSDAWDSLSPKVRKWKTTCMCSPC